MRNYEEQIAHETNKKILAAQVKNIFSDMMNVAAFLDTTESRLIPYARRLSYVYLLSVLQAKYTQLRRMQIEGENYERKNN